MSRRLSWWPILLARCACSATFPAWPGRDRTGRCRDCRAAHSSDRHVHLTCFTPGIPGERSAGTDPALGKANPSAGGTLQESDIPEWQPALDQAGDAFAAGDYTAQPAGTWAWPPRV